MSTTPLRYTGLIALTTVLAACNDGGGGGGGSSDPDFTRDVPDEDVAVKEENAEEVTDSSLRSADTIIGQGASGGGYGTPTIRSASDIPGDQSLVGSVHRFIESAREGASGLSTRATQSDTVNCSSSGTLSYSYTYPDDGDYTSQGAEWSMDFDNCVESGSRYNGSFTMTFEDGYDSGSMGDDWEVGWKLDYDDYRSEDATSGNLVWRAHGDMKLTFGSQTNDSAFTSAQQSFYYIISGDSFYVAYDDEVAHNRNYRLEYRIGASGDYLFAYDTQASTTGTGGWITVETTEKFEWSSSNYPENGELYIAGGRTDDPTQPTYVRLKAVQAGTTPQYYVDSGSGEVGPETFQNWDSLISEL
jgi:hypothetical protein